MSKGVNRLNTEIVNNMAEGAYLIRVSDGIILYTNPAFEKMFGYSNGEMLEQHASIVNAPSKLTHMEIVDAIVSDLKVNGTWKGEVENIKKNGEIFWCSAAVTTFNYMAYGEVWLFIHTDITDKKHKEVQLRQARKMDALGKLTSGVAHDSNNMLGVIIGYAKMLEDKLTTEPQLKSYAEKIHRAGDHSAQLIKKLLGSPKKHSSNLINIKINDMLNETKSMLENTLTSRIMLSHNLAGDLWEVCLDDGDLEDAILNLCINASHAIDGSGELTITTKNVSIDEGQARTLNVDAGDYVHLGFTDTGCGIEDEIKDKIFEPFFTSKGAGGTGIGLSQLYGFVTRSNGAVDVYSEAGNGSSFNLYFPRYHGSQSRKVETILSGIG